MTSEMFIELVGAVFTIATILITACLIPAIKSVISEKDLSTIVEIVEIAVKSADQLIDDAEYEKKKQYVENYVLDWIDKHINVKITKAELDAIIEGEVQRIHHLNGVR